MEYWTEIIIPNRSIFEVKFREVWRYRDLIYLFIKRDIVSQYKQTILGPLWFIIQPLITALIFTLVFGKIAHLSTDGIPPILFYLLGIVCWSYFSTCINKTANTFTANAYLFGKVYFPRLSVPIAAVISSLLFFTIQFGLFIAIWLYYIVKHPGTIHPNTALLWFPYMLFLLVTLSLGLGIIVSSLTTKYRDFSFLLGFGMQLWMYLSPIIYPSSEVIKRFPGKSIAGYINQINPISPLVETLRYGFLGKGDYSLSAISYSSVFIAIVLIIGILLFNRVERTFMDTV